MTSKNNYSVPEAVGQVINESQSEILASLKLTGVTNEEAAKQMGITLYKVRKLQENEEFKKHLSNVAESMVRTASNTWKGMMEDLIPLAHKALIQALKKGDLKGVEIVLKTLGIDKQTQAASGGTLQVILPDYKKETVINVKDED